MHEGARLSLPKCPTTPEHMARFSAFFFFFAAHLLTRVSQPPAHSSRRDIARLYVKYGSALSRLITLRLRDFISLLAAAYCMRRFSSGHYFDFRFIRIDGEYDIPYAAFIDYAFRAAMRCLTLSTMPHFRTTKRFLLRCSMLDNFSIRIYSIHHS